MTANDLGLPQFRDCYCVRSETEADKIANFEVKNYMPNIIRSNPILVDCITTGVCYSLCHSFGKSLVGLVFN